MSCRILISLLRWWSQKFTIYCNKKNTGQGILNIIKTHVPADKIEAYQTIEHLSGRLFEPRGDLIIMVLMASSSQDLLDLLLIRDLFYDIPIILILPDRKKDTVKKGHKFYPRFISYMDSDFSDVSLVLSNMLINKI